MQISLIIVNIPFHHGERLTLTIEEVKLLNASRTLALFKKPSLEAANGFANWIHNNQCLSEEDKLILLQGDDFVTLAEEKEDGFLDILIQGLLAKCLPRRLLQICLLMATERLMLTV